jgi:hypothetical protein
VLMDLMNRMTGRSVVCASSPAMSPAPASPAAVPSYVMAGPHAQTIGMSCCPPVQHMVSPVIRRGCMLAGTAACASWKVGAVMVQLTVMIRGMNIQILVMRMLVRSHWGCTNAMVEAVYRLVCGAMPELSSCVKMVAT